MMKHEGKVILLQLNEISKYCLMKSLQKNPNLKHFKNVIQDWDFLQTESEKEYENLEPWIQWVTVHTGKSFKEHGVFRLGDAPRELKHPQVWEVLQSKGKKSCIFGSMNAHPGEMTDGIFFPDPWSKDNMAQPAELKPLWDFISRKVHSHSTSKLAKSDYIKAFLLTVKMHVSPATYVRIAKQILSQKLNNKKSWRLASYFDLMLTDMFCSVLKKREHDFYTLFLNSVAHYQHHFWRKFEPEKFNSGIECPDCAPEDDPVSFGYEMFDELLGKILKHVDIKKDKIIISSGLTQIPYTASEESGGMTYYRLKKHAEFVEKAGLVGVTACPMMSRDWQVVGNVESIDKAQAILEAAHVDGEKLFNVRKENSEELFIETLYTKGNSDSKTIIINSIKFDFTEVFEKIAVKSGHHSTNGFHWSINYENKVVKESKHLKDLLSPLFA